MDINAFYERCWNEVEAPEIPKETNLSKYNGTSFLINDEMSLRKIDDILIDVGSDISHKFNYSKNGNRIILEDKETALGNLRSTSFSLTYKSHDSNENLALMGFDISSKGEIIIGQIQAKKGKYPGVDYPINWDKNLLEILKGYSDKLDIPLFMSMAKNNDSYNAFTKGNVSVPAPIWHKKKMVQRYDKLALSNDFEFNKERKMYEYKK